MLEGNGTLLADEFDSGPPPTSRPRKVDPTVEVAAGGARWFTNRILEAIGSAPGGLVARFGVASNVARRAMLLDPKVGSSVKTLKHSILSDGVTIMDPKAPPRPVKGGFFSKLIGRKPAEPDPAAEADYLLASEIVASCRRAFDRLDVPMTEILYEMLDAASFGNRAAEVTWAMIEDGVDEGRMTLSKVKVKPESAYRFVVDAFGNHVGFLVRVPKRSVVATDAAATMADPMANRWVFLPREKMAVLTWEGRDGDPRGNSILDPIAMWWEVKMELAPDYQRYMNTFATPSLVGKLAPNAAGRTPTEGEVDASDPTSRNEVPPQKVMLDDLLNFQGGTAIVIPAGAELNSLEIYGDGSVYINAIRECDKQIVAGILGQTRATEESQFGSRADSQTGQDIMGLVGRYGRRLCARMIETDILYPLILANFGKDAADRLTPSVSLGQTEHQDFPARAHAMAALAKSGLLRMSQLPSIWAFLGLEPAMPGDDEPIPMPAASGSQDQSNNGDPKGPQDPTPPGRKAWRPAA